MKILQTVVVCLLLAHAFAQAPTGEITGTVTDATGGVVSGATVTVTNLGTNVQRTIATNTSGIYDAPALPPGAYSVRVTMAGFRTDLVNRVEVQVGQVARLNFSLEVGNVAETVEVQATAATLETETTSVGTVVEQRRILELPLNGRNYLQLASLIPGSTTYGPPIGVGAQRMGGDRNNFALNVAGSRTEFNHYTLDGVLNTDPNFGTYLFQPSVDALQEFKVEAGTYSAEFGHGLGQVNVITRSGTNEYHGTLFEFLRNAKLDAKNYFDNRRDPIPPFKRNQFGFVLGGPVQIPKVLNGKNRLFFFFNYEGLRQRKAQTSLSAMPFESDKRGDFTGRAAIITDPLTRGADGRGTPAPFAGNVVPASRISPVSRMAFDRFYPLPNRGIAGYANNYLSNESAAVDSDQQLARVDWAHTSNSNFQFRYSHGDEPQYAPATIPDFGTLNTTVIHLGMLGHTWALGANKVNEAKIGITRLESYNSNLRAFDPAQNFVGQAGIAGPTNIPIFYGVPFFQITNLGSVGDPANGPYLTFNTILQFNDHFSWNVGKHSIKMGAEIHRTRFNLMGNDVARGRFTFTGNYTQLATGVPVTEHAIADFLLGMLRQSETQTGFVVANLRNHSLNFYLQDQWKATPKLTVNYGLRYEFEPGFRDTRDRLVNIDFRWDHSVRPTLVRAGSGDFYEGNPPFPLPANIPFARDGRFGNRTNRNDLNNWAPRLGFAYSITPKTVIRSGFGIYYVKDIGNALFDVMRNPPFTVRLAENANSLIPNLTWNRPFTAVGSPTLSPAFLWYEPTTYIPQWSFGIQRELGKSLSLETAYVGSSGVHLERTSLYNAPEPGPPGDLNLRRPFLYLGNIQLVSRPGHSSYHSFQAKLQRRFAQGFTVLSSFTYGKSIDNGSGVRVPNGDNYTPGNNNDLRTERGLSIFDFRKRLTTSFLWELPFGKGKAFLNGGGRVVDTILGGWQLGGILTLQDGFPFAAFCSNATTYQNNGTTCRADAVGINPALAGDQRGPSRWFNTAAFVDRTDFVPGAGPYRYGNAGRNNIIGPGITELDFSLNKFFVFTERVKLEFRSEFFNVPNRPIFGIPGSTVRSPTYGVIGSTRLDSRQIQFGLKLSF